MWTKSKISFFIVCFIDIFILFVQLAFQMLIEELGKFLNNPLAKINIFLQWFIGIKKTGLAKSWPDWVVDKIKDIFSIIYFINIFILFIYFSLQRLITEPGKLSIDPLTKIIIFFLWFIGTKKERLCDFWLDWIVEVKKAFTEKRLKDLLYYLFY